MKKIIALVLTVVMVASMAAVVSFAADTIGETTTTWEVADGVLTIAGEGEMPDFTIDNTGDGNRPWNDVRDEITKVVISEGVTATGKNSFARMASLAEVEIAASCTTIKNDSFAYNGALETITFNGAVETIGQGIVFGSVAIKTVYLSGQTEEQFKAIASVKPYNLASNGGMKTGFDNCDYVAKGQEPPKPENVFKFEPYQKGMENWKENTQILICPTIDGKFVPELLSNTDIEWTITIKNPQGQYKTFTTKQSSNYDGGTWGIVRFTPCTLDPADKFVPVKDAEYEITVAFTYNGVDYAYTCETPYVLADVDPIDPTPNDPMVWDGQPPVTADASVYMIVVAVVAMLGMAVVVAKKVNA